MAVAILLKPLFGVGCFFILLLSYLAYLAVMPREFAKIWAYRHPDGRPGYVLLSSIRLGIYHYYESDKPLGDLPLGGFPHCPIADLR